MKKQTVFRIALSVFLALAVFVTPILLTSQADAAKCGNLETSIIDCGSGVNNKDNQTSGVWALLLIGINILTALIGIAAVGGIIYGAILYTTSAGESGKVEKAIEVFRNVVIGVVAYALMYVGLNFIIPGGVFN